MRYCFVFVCQEGELEVKSALLAASLRRYLECECELVAAIPAPADKWGEPAKRTRQFLERAGVRAVNVRNLVDENYPIGNKVSCLSIETAADKIVFLDSDILMMRPFRHDPRFEVAFNAKPADTSSFSSSPEVWRAVYACVGLDLPQTRMRSTISGVLMPPYYNAGVVAVHAGAGIGEEWLRCCRAVDNNPQIPRKRPWLDQIALPLAVVKLGLRVDLLDDAFNYPAHVIPLDEANPPVLCHYHQARHLANSPAALAVVNGLIEEYPELRDILTGRPEWGPLFCH